MDGSALSGSRQNRRRLTLSIVAVVLLAGSIFLAGRVETGGLASQAREFGLVLLTPVRWVASLPGRYQQHKQAEQAEADLKVRFEQLQLEHQNLQARLLLLEGLRAENRRLRILLGASERVPEKLQAVNIARRAPLPLPHRLILDAGSADGLMVGAPVLSPTGVLGQLESVTQHESVVILATEIDHAIPALVARTGATTIVHGTGSSDSLRVSWLPQNTDIRVGDRLLTSGLGKRFPDGLPVAEITSVKTAPGERFLQVAARPLGDSAAYPEVLVVMEAAANQGIGQTEQ